MCSFTPLQICREVKAQRSLECMRRLEGSSLKQHQLQEVAQDQGRDGIPQPLWASALVWVPSQWKAFSLLQIWISCLVAHVWCLSSFCHVTLEMSLAQPVLHLPIRHSNKCSQSLSAISHPSFNPARISPISLDGNYGREGQRPCWSQVGNITCSPLSHTASQPMREGNPGGQAHLAHGNSMLAVTNHRLNLCVWKWFPAGSAT